MRQSPRLAGFAKQVPVPALVVLAASAAFLFGSSDAHAVMRGQGAGAISRHVVKMVGHNLLCSATVIGRQQLLTANHCVESGGPFFVVAGGSRIAVTSHSAQGQTTLLTLASPLPASYVPIATGETGGDGSFTIAGYGTAHEAERMHSAGLREARLVTDRRYGALVDPRRRGAQNRNAPGHGKTARNNPRRFDFCGPWERSLPHIKFQHEGSADGDSREFEPRGSGPEHIDSVVSSRYAMRTAADRLKEVCRK